MSGAYDNAFPHIAGKVDISIHRGDMKMIGRLSGLRHHREAIDQLSSLDAEVELVIADNHGVSLDPKWWSDNVVALPYAATEQFRPTAQCRVILGVSWASCWFGVAPCFLQLPSM